MTIGWRHRLSPAEKSGFIALAVAAGLGFVEIRLATVPLTGLVVICLAAPFFPGYGFFLPVVSRGCSGKRAVALTFDDGPDPVTTPMLLRLLASYRVSATFFLTGQRAARYPHLVRDILQGGHQIGNHGFRHDNLIMLKNREALAREISAAQDVLRSFGIVPRAFRPPVGITNPRLGSVLNPLGMFALTFRRRAGDFGNRRIRQLARRVLRNVQPDDILLLHDLFTGDSDDCLLWLREVECILRGLGDRGLEVIPLPHLIGRPVMDCADRVRPCLSGRVELVQRGGSGGLYQTEETDSNSKNI